MTQPWIQTLKGHKFCPLNPDPKLIDIGEIARVLSRLPRFGGHTIGDLPYSVAQHSVMVSVLVPDRLALPALLHDAHEAYSGFGDVASPMKQWRGFKEHCGWVEHGIDFAVAQHFRFNWSLFYHANITLADRVALATEKRDLMAPEPCPWCEMPEPLDDTIDEIWVASEAEQWFLDRYDDLTTPLRYLSGADCELER